MEEAFLEKFHPQIRSSVRQLLSFGAEVRKLRNQVQADAAAARLDEENRYKTTVEDLRRKLDAAISSIESSMKTKNKEALLQACQQFCIIRGMLSKAISEGKQSIEKAAEELPSAKLLQTQAQLFRAQFEQFEEKEFKQFATSGAKVPWQLSYCVETDPFHQGGVVEFSGGKITDAEGNDVWEDLCSECGVSIQRALVGKGTVRYRDAECKHVVFCECCYRWNSSLQQLASAFAHEETSRDFLGPMISPHFARECYLSRERDHPVIARLDIFDDDVSPQPKAVSSSSSSGHRPLSAIVRSALSSPCYANRLCVGVKQRVATTEQFRYQWLTYEQVLRRAENFAAGMKALGILNEGDFVGTCARNAPEWIISDLAACLSGFVNVGLQTTLTDAELSHLIELTQLKLIICSESTATRIQSTLSAFPSKCSSLQAIVIIFDHTTNPNATTGFPAPLTVRSFAEIETRGAQLLLSVSPAAKEQKCTSSPSKIFTLIFTSGSTGVPKGAVVTEQNWIRDINEPDFTWPQVLCSFLPSALGADRSMVWRTLLNGGRIGYSNGGVELFEDTKLLRPSAFFAPPAIWASLYAEFQRQVTEMRNANTKTSSLSDRLESLRVQFATMLGDRIQWIGTGGASSNENVLQWMRETYRVPVLEGYGATEVGGIASNGKIDPRVQIKLIDVPEMGYFAKERRGELFVRSPISVKQYFKNELETSEQLDAADGGWFRTGDIVELSEDEKRIKVIDRRKNFFKLSVGEFIAPAKLESIYAESPLVDQICIVGDSSRPYIIAAVVPNEHLRNQLSSLSADENQKRQHTIHKTILAALASVAAHHKLKCIEIPRELLLLTEKWSFENSLLTATLKLNRLKIKQKYSGELSAIFARIDAHSSEETVPTEFQPYETALSSISAQFLAAVKELLRKADSDEQEELLLDRSLVENGADSMTCVRLRMRFLGSSSSAASRQISTAQFLNLPIRKLLDLLSSAAKEDSDLLQQYHKAESVKTRDAIQRDILSDPLEDLEGKQLQLETSAESADHILLTGSSGFLGAHLLNEFLSSCSQRYRKITCLVRAENHSAAREKQRTVSSQYALQSIDPFFDTVLEVLAGDVSKSRFGLSSSEFDSLRKSVSVVYHCAASMNFLAADYNRSNVVAMQEVLRFVCSTQPAKSLCYISTLSVFGSRIAAGDTLFEDDQNSDVSCVSNSDGYSMSKWVCEQLLFNCIRKHPNLFRVRDCALSCSVIRLGLVGFSSVTGIGNQSDWFSMLLRSMLASGSKPHVPLARFNLIPVDLAARVIRLIGEHQQQPTTETKAKVCATFHLAHNNDLSFDEMVQEWFPSTLKAARTSPSFSEWLREVQTRSDDVLLPLVPFLHAGLPPVGRIRQTRTVRFCEQSGLQFAAIPAQAGQKYAQFLLNSLKR